MDKRNVSIDVARWIFAFLVVTLHSSFWHSNLLIPFARCAVPFFYMASGYLIISKPKIKYRETAIKWLRLWLKYTVILLFLGTIWDYFYLGHIKEWTINDTVDILLQGSNKYIDEHEFGGRTYGISTLWFLYAGGISFIVFFKLHRFLFRKWFIAVMITFLFASNFTNYILNIKYDECFRLFFMSIPFTYLGGAIRKMRTKEPNVLNYVIILLLWLIALFEIRYIKSNNMMVQNIFITCIPLSLLLFYTIINKVNVSGVIWVRSLPIIATLDIYIWHRIAIFILSVLNCYYGPLGSIEAFIVTAIISITIRNNKK